MNNSEFKEVNFVYYCRTCKHQYKKDFEDPCNDCLTVGVREGTQVPEEWEADEPLRFRQMWEAKDGKK